MRHVCHVAIFEMCIRNCRLGVDLGSCVNCFGYSCIKVLISKAWTQLTNVHVAMR